MNITLLFLSIYNFVFIFLNLSTNHNRYILVPDLVGKNLIEINEILNENKLNFESKSKISDFRNFVFHQEDLISEEFTSETPPFGQKI